MGPFNNHLRWCIRTCIRTYSNRTNRISAFHSLVASLSSFLLYSICYSLLTYILLRWCFKFDGMEWLRNSLAIRHDTHFFCSQVIAETPQERLLMHHAHTDHIVSIFIINYKLYLQAHGHCKQGSDLSCLNNRCRNRRKQLSFIGQVIFFLKYLLDQTI